MYLITYSCGGRLAYDTTENIVDWLLIVNDNDDAPYFIVNTERISASEYFKIDGKLAGM